MAWEDRTTFDAIKFQFGLSEQQVIALMDSGMKLKSFKLWRKRVQGRKTKHSKLREFDKGRFKCSRQSKSRTTLFQKIRTVLCFKLRVT